MYYSLVALFIATWSLGLGMFYFEPQAEHIWFWLNVIDFSGSLIATFFLLFSFVFHTEIRLGRKRTMVMLLPTLIVGYLLFFTHTINQGIMISNRGIFYGPYSFIFFSHFTVYLVAAFYNLFHVRRGMFGVARLQMNYVIFGTVFTAVFSSLASMVLPVVFHNFAFMHIGPYLTLIMVGLFMYAMWRYEHPWDFFAQINKTSGFV